MNASMRALDILKRKSHFIEQNSKYRAVTFIDSQKAFDTVNHDILIQKLKQNGIKTKKHVGKLSNLVFF